MAGVSWKSWDPHFSNNSIHIKISKRLTFNMEDLKRCAKRVIMPKVWIKFTHFYGIVLTRRQPHSLNLSLFVLGVIKRILNVPLHPSSSNMIDRLQQSISFRENTTIVKNTTTKGILGHPADMNLITAPTTLRPIRDTNNNIHSSMTTPSCTSL